MLAYGRNTSVIKGREHVKGSSNERQFYFMSLFYDKGSLYYKMMQLQNVLHRKERDIWWDDLRKPFNVRCIQGIHFPLSKSLSTVDYTEIIRSYRRVTWYRELTPNKAQIVYT